MTPIPEILCLGAVLWDIIGRTDQTVPLGADLPGRITRQPGGVALNIAATLARLGLRPALLTAIGRDPEGRELTAACARLGLITTYVHRPTNLPTDRYLAIEGAGGLIAAIADAHTLETAGAKIMASLIDGRLGSPQTPWPGMIALDGNLTAALLTDIAQNPAFARADLRIAPASPDKAQRLMPLLGHPNATLYLNLAEARLLGHTDAETAAEAATALLAHGARRVLVTDGSASAADGRRGAPVITQVPPQVPVTRITGAGDTFMAAHIVAERRGADREAALDAALQAAAAFVSGKTAP